MSYQSEREAASTPTFLNPRAPPPPPPKPQSEIAPQRPSSQQQHSSSTGPPLPPPPPTSTRPPVPEQHTPTPSSNSYTAQPPSSASNWLPEILLEKPTTALQPVLSDTNLLSSLASQHPSLTPSLLPPHLSQTQQLAQQLQAQHAQLLALRQQIQSRLLQLHGLERQWRQKQSEVDKQLEPWSPKNLYQRLVVREREGEDWCRVLEESFLEGDEKVGEKELGEFLRRFREGRRGVGRRKEERARWDEGRVGGWR